MMLAHALAEMEFEGKVKLIFDGSAHHTRQHTRMIRLEFNVRYTGLSWNT